jgi:hypothetical protein
MAKNYTFAEAVKIINAGTDMESITDIGRRYPVLLHKVTNVAAKAGEAFVDLMNYMPDYLTANKVNTALKNATGTTDEDDTDADAAGAEGIENEVVESAVKWDESMSSKQLWDILGKAGKRKLAKSTKKADLIEACKQAFGAIAETEVENETEIDSAEETTEANPYEGKSAMELFKECKKRGIKAAPKKPAAFYAELLVKADAEATTEAESESDDWDEEEEAKEEPKAKKAEKKVEKKAPTKKAETEEDDDWDI